MEYKIQQFGFNSLKADCGNYNTALGAGSLTNCTGTENTAIGQAAGNGMTSGSQNVAIGYASLDATVTGKLQCSCWCYVCWEYE